MTRSLFCYKDNNNHKIIYLLGHTHKLSEVPKIILINNHENIHRIIYLFKNEKK